MNFVVQMIRERADRSDHLTVLARQEERRFRMFKEGILLRIEKLFPLGDQGRHPVGVALINFPGEYDELFKFPLIGNERNLSFGHLHPGLYSQG